MKHKFTPFDIQCMARAISIAENGRGSVGTNPLVGAVVTRGGKMVAEGWHARYGGPHAEAVALARAGGNARGGTAYVSLEPCSHPGKTPPCTRMIVASGIKRVVYACGDPHERGAGERELRRAGIQVSGGFMEAESAQMNSEYFVRLRQHAPYVFLKLAMTIDGKIADYRGRSKWITSPVARSWTRSLRSGVDAIMVGSGTVLADNPRLTAPPGGSQPIRVIVDSKAVTPVRSRLMQGGRVLIACTEGASRKRVSALRKAGAEVVEVGARHGRVDLRRLMGLLLERGVGSLVCEGGARLAGSLLEAKLVNRMVVVLSPRLLGGTRSLSAVIGRDFPLSSSRWLSGVKVSRLGMDILVEGNIAGKRGG